MLKWIKNQFLHVLPVFIFFLIAFTIINLTETYLLKRAGLSTYSFFYLFLCALVISKIILVIDNLPFINLFHNKPLIYNTLWKTVIYWAITFCVRIIIRFSPFLGDHDGLQAEIENFREHFDWYLFYSVQAWYLMLFFLFVTARELTMIIGVKKMRQIFFGKFRK